MIVSVYPIDEHRGIWSFREQPNTAPTRVRVPAKSVLREVKTVGLLLFVAGADPRVRAGWPANAVMSEASREGGRFSVVGREVLASRC